MKKCPVCDVVMNEVIKIDILIDVCPKCLGVWLDRGELEKIISKYQQVNTEFIRDNNDHYDDHHYDKDDYYKKDHGRRKRGGFLESLFD